MSALSNRMSQLVQRIKDRRLLAPRPRRIDVAAITHIGGRSENQDAHRVFNDADTGECLVVVADGLGGQGDGGGLAARTAIDSAAVLWAVRRGRPPEDLLEALVMQAHEDILHAAAGADAQTTLAALYIDRHVIVSVHAGDSRVSQFARDGFVKRTLDHSMAQIQVLRGKLKESEMASSPSQSRLITSLGGPERPEYEISEWSIGEGERFVVCSDGFWEIFTPDEQAALLNARELQSALDAALKAKLDTVADNHDNTTAVLLRVALPPLRRWLFPGGAWLLAAAIALAGLAYLVLGGPASRPPADDAAPAVQAQGGLETAPSEGADKAPLPPPLGKEDPSDGSLDVPAADAAEQVPGGVETAPPEGADKALPPPLNKNPSDAPAGVPADDAAAADQARTSLETAPPDGADQRPGPAPPGKEQPPDAQADLPADLPEKAASAPQKLPASPAYLPGKATSVPADPPADLPTDLPGKATSAWQPRPGTLKIEKADIAIDSAADAAVKLTDRLRDDGLLGADDSLVHEAHGGGELGPVERYEQVHGGIPVEDGQVIVHVQDGRIVTVTGRVQPDIALPAAPLLEFEQALERAANSLGVTVSAQSEAQRRIWPNPAGGHVPVWRVDVEVGSALRPEQWLINAHSGAVVQRRPRVVDAG